MLHRNNSHYNQFHSQHVKNHQFQGFSDQDLQTADKLNEEVMKVKEIEVTANVAWSPKDKYPVMLAAGTAAQQLDASFDTTSNLDIYNFNLNEVGPGLSKINSVPVESRFHSLVWAPNVLVGGMERGVVQVFDVNKLMQGHQENVVLFSKDKHTGSVNTLDLNPFQANLMASGASESEIFIWDLNKLAMPMTPGAKAQPLEDVKCVAWNRQVQHILASTASSKCVVWDLRKNEPIIKVSDTSGARMRYKPVAWHPEVATQLCIASEDDHTPVIQIWDLRLASSPLKTLDAHTKGVLSIAWCEQDSDLLMSCGKDMKILCWNPNSQQENGEVLCELAHSSSWSFDLSWCPRNPAVIAASSFDSKVSIYSLMGGQEQVEQSTTSNIADSFPGMENMQPVAPTAKPKSQSVQLKKPPKWLKRPCGASFGFGGKLVTFESVPKEANKSIVKLGSVVTEQDLVQRSCKLETSLQNGNMAEFCEAKIGVEDKDKLVWQYIKANFETDYRTSFLTLLDYEPNDVKQKISAQTGTPPANAKSQDLQDFPVSDRIDAVADDFSNLGTESDTFDTIAAKEASENQDPFDINVDESGSGYLSKSLLTGNLDSAVEICLEQNRIADAIILALQGDQHLMERVQAKYFEKSTSKELPLIRAVVKNDWTQVIQNVNAENWKEALVAVLTYAEDNQMRTLCTKLGSRLMEVPMKDQALLCFICARNLDQVVQCWMDIKSAAPDSPEALQDLVEVVMTLKAAAERMNAVPVEVHQGPLAVQLANYANILASQGALSAALTYLGQSNEESINLLRERLTGALGVMENSRKVSNQSNASRRSTANAANAGSAYQRPSWNSGGSGGTGIHNPAMEPDRYQPPVPHLDQGGITQRRGSRPPSEPVPSYDPYARSTTDHMSSYQQPSYMTPAPTPAASQPPVNIFTPDFSQSYSQAPPPPTGAVAPPPVANAGIDHGIPVSSGPGWNDPPAAALALAKARAEKKTNTVNSITAPITAPIMQPLAGVPETAPPVQAPPMNYGYQQPYYGQQQQSYDQAPVSAPMMPPMTPAAPAANMSYQQGGYYDPNNVMTPQAPEPVSAAPPAPVQPVQPVEKGPIPAEHLIIQEVFDTLRERCLAAANHPQIKRKLVDVAKKLDVLYDKLREGSLTTNITTGLHQMIQYVWAYDYDTCLQVVNQMVSSGGSFALLAEFMPGVKVLIQVAKQMGVYIERPASQ